LFGAGSMRHARVFRLGLSSLDAQTTFRTTRAKSRAAFVGFTQLVRRNWLFAVSEISKGVVIIGFGDFATADAVGDFVSNVIPSAAPLAAILATRTFS
jgi:hypothetical protein